MTDKKPLVFTRAHLADQLSAAGYGSKAQARELLDALLRLLRTALLRGDTVAFNEFGRFEVRTLPAHVRRSLQTGEPIQVAERKQVKFKPSNHLLKETAP